MDLDFLGIFWQSKIFPFQNDSENHGTSLLGELISYFFGYKKGLLPSNTIKNLDPFYRIYGNVLTEKTYLEAEFHTTDLHIYGVYLGIYLGYFWRKKILSYKRINMVEILFSKSSNFMIK